MADASLQQLPVAPAEAREEAQVESCAVVEAPLPRSGELVKWALDIDPYPPIAKRALTLLQDSQVSLGALSDLVMCDVGLAARVMRVANSALYNRPRQLATLDHALMAIGLKTLRGILLSSCMQHSNSTPCSAQKMLWEHALVSAIACREISRIVCPGKNAEEFYALGLFHDLGKFLLQHDIPETYQEIIALTQTGICFVDAEKKTLSYAHQLVGAMLATKWNFPESLCIALLGHHQPVQQTPDEPAEVRRAIVQYGDLMAHHLGYGHNSGYPSTTREFGQLGRLFGLKRPVLDTILKRVEAGYLRWNRSVPADTP